MTRAEELAKEHAEWMEGLLKKYLEFTIHLYRDAIIHGYKHGTEDEAKIWWRDENTIKKTNSASAETAES